MEKELELHEQKKRLRREITARVRLLPAHARAAASELITRQVLALPQYRDAQSIFLYLSMPTEPDTRKLLSTALADGKRVYVPKCISDGEMLAVRIQSTDALAPGAYGILEPVDCTETAPADALDLILVPCVAASLDGRRLGHGKGYYDRFLQGNAEKAVCLCFAAALSDEIPTEPTDIRIPAVLSDGV